LIKVILPPIDSCLPFHVDSCFLIASTIGFQVLALLGLAPIGIPINLKGKCPIQQCKKQDATAKKSLETLIPKILLFEKFTRSPDANSKVLNMDLRYHKL
jgi:hypothetical protein